MSFKREGNDAGLLANLRRRRVTELFGEDIPEDEAKLLCNGRLTCLVCGHHPVFDTVNMLMVHRQGKKHARNEEGFLKKKKELQALIVKRKHEQYVKDGTTSIRQAATTSSGIGHSQPYDPRVKKPKMKPYDRKPCLDLHSDPVSSQLQTSVSNGASHLCAFSMAVPQKHNRQLKKIFEPSLKNQGPVTPYVRQHRTGTDSGSASCQPAPSAHCLPPSDHHSSQTGWFGHPQHSVSRSPFSSSSSSSSTTSHSACSTPPATSVGLNDCSSSSAFLGVTTLPPAKSKCQDKRAPSAGVSQQECGNLCTMDNDARVAAKGADSGPPSCRPVEQGGKPGAEVGGAASATASTEKQRLAQKYYHLSGSGWKKDWDGKWIRDEEAEFDSDEEPPDLP